jgi:hypothetical protein
MASTWNRRTLGLALLATVTGLPVCRARRFTVVPSLWTHKLSTHPLADSRDA